MTIPHAVILTSIAWAAFATALVAYEKWAARRHYDAGFASWGEHVASLRKEAYAAQTVARAFEQRHLAAERGLREYARAVEHMTGSTQSFRGAARAGQEAPTVPGSWKA